ncbi:MAG: efflux RND transporter periplasmic adaptor subunit [Planctomycetota bacterium]|nr:efflux RND transporter periplasmic adaptor subunit [Planctomycetota bacterium]
MSDHATTSASEATAQESFVVGDRAEVTSGFSEFIVDSLPQAGSRAGSGNVAAHFLTVLRQLPLCLAESDDNAPALKKMAEIIGRVGKLDCLAWFERAQDGLSSRPEVYFPDKVLDLGHELAETAGAASSRMTETCGVSRDGTSWIVVASPVTGVPAAGGCLAGAFQIGRETPAWLAGQIELAALILGHSLTDRNRIAAEQELAAAAAIIDLASRLERASTFSQACQILADEMSRHTGCPQVAIGTLDSESGSCHLRACSGDLRTTLDTVERSSLEAALDEIVIRNERTVWPPESETQRLGLMTHRRLVEDGIATCVIGSPLRNRDGSVYGAWLFPGDSTLVESQATSRFILACEYRLAETLELVKRAQRPAWKRTLDQILKTAGGSPRRTATFATVMIAGLLAIPLPHNVSGKCELQPVTRRFIAAPFAGTLDKTLVEPGDVVVANQLLARMDDREIKLEVAGADAEHHRAAKERDTHLAKQDIASAQLARYEMERLQLRQRLLTHRSENLEIRTPIPGLVIAGDLKRSEGIPLATGDTLFEIAPIDRMVVEVAIPETDIAFVATGQEVSVVLEGFRGDSLTGQLIRVHPRSEMKDDEHVFIGEVEFDNPDGRLLPGMHGGASIDSGLEPLGWIIFHRPYEAFLFWMGW